MNRLRIIEMQKRIGTEPDGFWGPKSIAACQAHLKKLMPSPNPWPAPDDASMNRFYGSPMDESKLVNLEVSDLGVYYFGKQVRVVRCHHKVAPSLRKILEDINASPHASILREYAGCYNPRPMRGGTRPSKHAWGVAIDLDPDENGLKQHWPSSASMPLEVMEAFAKEGWVGLGWQIGRDAMHMQASQ